MSCNQHVLFKTFCDICMEISRAERDKKPELLRSFIDNWRKNFKNIEETNSRKNLSFFPVLRLLLPHLDRERGAYGVKENTLAKIYIRILCLPKNGNDATKLLDYRAPKSGGNQSCDFAEVAYWILKNRCSKGEELSLNDINDHLDAIALKHGTNDPRGVDSELIALLRKTSAEEQKWLIRIILKDMKLGLGQSKLLNVYHPDAQDYYDSCNDLRKICDVLSDPTVRLNEIGIEVFSPFRPMLSEECDVSKVENYLKKSPYFFIETKLDGERFQVHMKQGDYKYFSRNGHEYTSSFGRNRYEGTLTPKLVNQIRNDVECIILDGEMMCWNLESESYVTKGMNSDVKNLKETSRYTPCFCVFDLLYLDGRVLTNQPLNYRLTILSEVITPKDGVIVFVDRKRISLKEQVWDSLNEAIENREEGIVMKDFLSVYKPNVRKNGGWYKLKPEYTDGLMDALDLLIIGGYYGGGRHKGNISHFLLGVVDDSEKKEEPEKFASVARVGSGYTMEELLELQLKLKPYWNKVVPGETPIEIEWTKEKPDLWILPCKSFILQVKASEIMPSDSFKTGYTLRFPRVEKVRYDKTWTECLKWTEFDEKRNAACGKLVKRLYENIDSGENVSRRKKLPQSTIFLPPQFRSADLSKVECRSDLLKGKEICVFSGFHNFSKNDIEVKIAEFGGSLVQNPGVNTYCVLAEEESNVRISNIIKCGLYDVIRTSWFISQLNLSHRAIPELTPNVLLGPSQKTAEIFSKIYDEYGDHFTKIANMQSLQHPFKVIEAKAEIKNPSRQNMYDLDMELFSGLNPYGLFRICTAYFDKFGIIGDPCSECLNLLELWEIDFKFYGGTSTEYINEETSHVVVSINDLTRLDELKEINRHREKKFHLVTEDWIKCSLAESVIKEERQFYPT